jgi:predicted alpha/beta hydrolase family esterase
VNKLVLLHGMNKSPNDVWYPWLGAKAREADMAYEAPMLTIGVTPVLSEWLEAITQAQPDGSTVLVGHSRGGMAILRWLEQASDDAKVGRVILVAANRGDSPDKASGDFFYAGDYDFAKIKQHCSDFVVFHSRDDQWVPFEAGEHNAEALGAQFVTFDNYGHFGAEMRELPELLEQVLR